jgi:Ras-related protein Rab-6A
MNIAPSLSGDFHKEDHTTIHQASKAEADVSIHAIDSGICRAVRNGQVCSNILEVIGKEEMTETKTGKVWGHKKTTSYRITYGPCKVCMQFSDAQLKLEALKIKEAEERLQNSILQNAALKIENENNHSISKTGGYLTPSVSPLAKYKVVFLGDQGVGKTSIITRFMYSSFEKSYQATVGIDFLSKTMRLQDKIVRLQLWDTAGQERFRSLIPSYVRDSSVAVVVYDVTKMSTFLNVSNWIESVRNERGHDCIIMVVGNKIDLTDLREVSVESAEHFAASHSAMFIECSAKVGSNVDALFSKFAASLPDSGDFSPKDSKDSNTAKVSCESHEHEHQRSSQSWLSFC